MTGGRRLFLLLTLVFLLASLAGAAGFSRPADAEPVSTDTAMPEALQGTSGAARGWWAAVQEDIRQGEYHITWQEGSYLGDLAAPAASLPAGAYQAPNRAHNLRAYFAPAGVRLIPRIFEGRTPPWEWGLTLSGYGYASTAPGAVADSVQPVAAATLHVDANRIEYERDLLTEWYVNDERGLEQGFTLHRPPQSAGQNPQSEIVLDLALSGNLTPRLATEGDAIEFSTPGGVTVLRYGELAAHDAGGRKLRARLSLSSGAQNRGERGIRITCDATNAVYPIAIDPLATTPDWSAESDQPNARSGYSVGTAGDVNGDGYSDVVVGAPYYDNGETDEGRAYVYHGSSGGLAASAAWIVESDQPNAQFGYSVGTAGDVNGDGYSDLVVGAPYYANGQTGEGRVAVYHGSATGLSTTAGWTAESDQANAQFGYSVGTAGDVNGDGYSDLVVGAPHYANGEADEGYAAVYHGSPAGLSATADWTAEGGQAGAAFGHAVGTGGDVNGDGFGDLVIGAPYYDGGDTDEGRVTVYHGSATGLSATADWTAESDQPGTAFGHAVGTAGDVNGDGYADLVIGAPYFADGETDEGEALVYHGGATGLSASAAWTAESDQAGALFGYDVGTAGDVDGDGYADLVVGAPEYDNGGTDEGQALVYRGGPTGLSPSADWTAEGDQAGAAFGHGVGTAGDVDGDGYSDLVIGAPDYDGGETDEGRATLYRGSATGLSATAAWTSDVDQAGAMSGYSVGTAGDVNGDGYSDVVVSAPGYDNGQENEGRIFVYHGSANGLAASAAWTTEGDQAGGCIGYSAGTAGDVDGDGYSDLAVGAPWYGTDQPDTGWVAVYHGSATGLSVTAGWTTDSGQAGFSAGWVVGTAGDVNGDGFSDLVVGAPYHTNGELYEGRATVYHGSATGLSPTADWTAEGDLEYVSFGDAVGTAGDVNGDGFSDLVVGALWYHEDQTRLGAAFVYHGSAMGLSPTPDWTARGEHDLAYFGRAVATAGDVNGDGYADLVVSAPSYGSGYEARVTAYHGSATGLHTTADWTVECDQNEAQFGNALGTAGDVNGDGYADVIVGARHYTHDQRWEGRATVYHGSAAGLSTTADWTAVGGQANAEFGYSVGTAGDVNGDGYADVIVGAESYDDNEQYWEGRAFLYYGNGGDGLHLLPRQLRSDGSAPIARLGASDAHTAFQLRLVGRMPLGREDVRLQWQVAPLGTAITAATGVMSGTGGWTDAMTTGVVISQTVTGLTLGMPYHWRARLLYRPGNALGQPASRWVHIPWAGWNEQDLRTLNHPPVAYARSDQITRTLALVTLDGSGSSDLDGDLPLTYLWSQTGGPAVTFTPNLSVTTFTAPSSPAVLSFTLVVTDSLGLPDPTPDEVMVTVTNPPTAYAGPDQTVSTSALVTLDGSGSNDPDGDLPLTYLWSQTGGPPVVFTPNLSVTTFTAPSDLAVLSFTLAVTDSLGLPDPTPDEVAVTVTNQSPVAYAGSDQVVNTNAPVTLDGSGSNDPDGDLPLTYLWSQTSGPPVVFTPNLSVTTFTAPSDPAVLTFTLVVTDSLGRPDPTPDEVAVTVDRYRIHLPLVMRLDKSVTARQGTHAAKSRPGGPAHTGRRIPWGIAGTDRGASGLFALPLGSRQRSGCGRLNWEGDVPLDARGARCERSGRVWGRLDTCHGESDRSSLMEGARP